MKLTSHFSCIGIHTVPDPDDVHTARAVLYINEIKPNNTPDYEKFDTLYLAIVVEDRNQEVNEGTASGKKKVNLGGKCNWKHADFVPVSIAILVGDLNDNAPVFDTRLFTSSKLVTEGASHDTSIYTVMATDADGPGNNKIEYSLV